MIAATDLIVVPDSPSDPLWHGSTPAVRWVRQEHAKGCGPATLAMIAGISYEQACVEIASQGDKPHDWNANGVDHMGLDRALMRHGFWVQADYRGWHENHIATPLGDPDSPDCDYEHRWELKPGHVWPPQPWATVHHASVVQPSGNAHFVVMLANGDVLDPLREGTFSLSDWPSVSNVMGLMHGSWLTASPVSSTTGVVTQTA